MAKHKRQLIASYAVIMLSCWIYLYSQLYPDQQWLLIGTTGLMGLPYVVTYVIGLTYRYPRLNRRVLRLRANGGKHTDQQWARVLAKQHYRCACCQNTGALTKDHIIPVSRGGTDHISNIQALCQSCNSKKGTKIIDYR